MRLGGSSAQDLLAIQDLTQMCADLEDLIRGPIYRRLRLAAWHCTDQRTTTRLNELAEEMLATVDRIENGGSA